MLSKKAKSRIVFLSLFLILTSLVIYITLSSLKKNVVYFFSPTEVYVMENIDIEKKIRVGGIVKEGSIKRNNLSLKFIITDLKNEMIISYKGPTPNLFSEGKGVVAEGKLKDKKYFVADTILAKHDENYMPPEVNDILQKQKINN
jgi:cytochrome c-type biogenesis protein CcmE